MRFGLADALNGFQVDDDVDECVLIADAGHPPQFGTLNAQVFGLTVDPFGGGPIIIRQIVFFRLPIQQYPQLGA